MAHRIKSFCFVTIFLFFNWPVKATVIEFNYLTLQDSFTADSETSMSRKLYDIGIGIFIGKSQNLLWELVYGSGFFLNKNTTTTTFSVTDFGIKLGYFWTKQKNWFTSITYNFVSNAKFDNGTYLVDLRGTSYKADFGYFFWPTETIGIGVKIFYYSPIFTERVYSGSLSKVSYYRSIIYPSLNFIFSF